ncbi:MAG: hypothetical protein ACYCSG_05675, partial [Thermoplasmataceae archaeon]
MAHNIDKRKLISMEFIFLTISIIYCHKMLFDVFSSSPLEIAYYRTYSVGFPSNYLSLWGYI